MRYNLLTEKLRPFLKGGWGRTWYRLERGTLGGVPMQNPNGPWIHKPSGLGWLLPNTWHVGTGVEFNALASPERLLAGLHVALRAEWSLYWHDFGLREGGALELAPELAIGLLDGEGVRRSQFNFALVLGF